jgi:hypothetical protein
VRVNSVVLPEPGLEDVLLDRDHALLRQAGGVGACRPVTEVQVAVVVVVMTVVMAVLVAVIVVVVFVAVAFQPRALALTASAYRAHGSTSEPVNESPAVARRTLGVPGKARGCTKERT